MIEFRFCPKCEKIAPTGTKCQSCGGNVELKEPHFFVGKLFGKYRIEGVLGQGGMGVVFLARHSILGRLSALKVIIPDLVSDADTFLERFLREAQLLAGLKHPNIVDIYDFDISDYGLPYYAMEYVEGISLRNLLACEGRNLSIEDLGSVLNMCASALDYSHKKGIVHRDLKPENILISLSENKVVPKILDFGIAKMLTQESSKTLTGEGNIIGTLHYIAPEQILGGKISPKTDQYSFALIVAEIVSGKILREGKTLGEICASDIQKPLDKNRLPENVSENIATAIQKATSKEPDLRYATVSDFVSALEIKEPEKPDKLTLIVQRTTIGVSPTITPQFSKDILSQLSSKKSKTVSSSPSTPIPPLSANKPKPIFLYGAIVFAVFLAVLATILFVFKKSNKKEYDKKEYLICQKTGEWQVPPDTSAVLSSFEGTSAILKGAKSLYMVKFLTNQVPSSFPIEQSEIFIGITPTGDPFFLNNGKIVRKNLEESSEKIIMDFSKEKYDFATVSNSARTLAVGGNKTIYFYSLLFENNAPISKISLEFPISEFKAKKLSDKFFAFIANGIFTVYDISNGNKILSVPFSENVFSVFIDDVSEYAAVWGWFDKISVFSLNGGENKDIRITGEPRDLIIIPDRPTIVVSGTFGIRFIDLKSSEVFYEDSAEGKALSSLLYSPKGILALNKEKSALMQYSLRTSEPDKIVKVCDNEIWAITKDIKNETLYLGGVDGKIYCVDKNDLIKTKELHTLGVTALATCEDHLISSSDDKSIAVLKLPSLDVEYRSTAHTYLINYLLVKGTPKKLWSSSSDGSLKSWSIPNLQEIFSFSVEAELKKKSSLHAFWVSQDEKKMVIGTWNHKVVYINKENSPKEMKIFNIPSHASLEIVELKKINALLIVGCYADYGLYLFDLLKEKLFALPQISPNPAIFAAASDTDEQTAYLCPFGNVLKLKFARDNQDNFSYEGSLYLIPEIGSSSVMLSPLEKEQIVSANSNGEIVFIKKSSLKPQQTFKGVLKESIPKESIALKIN